MDFHFWQTIIAGSAIAAAGGIIGSFALLRRMALVGDALSHVALPGLALGLIFHFNPFWGSLAFLLLATTAVWGIEHKSKLPPDTLVGVLFVLALAVGAMLTPKEEMLKSLFGSIVTMSTFDFWVSLFSSAFIIIFLLAFLGKFTLSLISADLARARGLKPRRIELFFLTLFAFVVSLGIKFTGALLMGSLIIIPAAIARNLSSSMKGYISLSALIGASLAVISIFIAFWGKTAPGPIFVVLAGSIFFLSIFFKK